MTEVQTGELELGPIDYLVVEYPDGNPTGEALPYLVDLVERGIVRLLDVAMIAKGEDGQAAAITLEDLGDYGAQDFALFDGASTGMIGDEDIAEVAVALSPGAVGVILVYENSWAAPFASALRRAGGQLVANGRIPVNAILAALEIDEEEL
jgi:hypothetical protein